MTPNQRRAHDEMERFRAALASGSSLKGFSRKIMEAYLKGLFMLQLLTTFVPSTTCTCTSLYAYAHSRHAQFLLASFNMPTTSVFAPLITTANTPHVAINPLPHGHIFLQVNGPSLRTKRLSKSWFLGSAPRKFTAAGRRLRSL